LRPRCRLIPSSPAFLPLFGAAPFAFDRTRRHRSVIKDGSGFHPTFAVAARNSAGIVVTKSVMRLRARFRSARGNRGFTLLEALVALAVMTAGLAAIGKLGFSSLAAARRAEGRLELTSALRRALIALPDRRASPNGRFGGQVDVARWDVAASPYPAQPGGPANSGWSPQALTVTATDGAGGRISIPTIRLRRSSAP
jgi:general secretion pathway protein I